MKQRQGRDGVERESGSGSGERRRLRTAALVAIVVVIALLAGTSAVALRQRDRARDQLAESQQAAGPLLAWLEQAMEREDSDDDFPLDAAARLQRAVGGAGSEARAQGFALSAMLPAQRALVADVQEAAALLAKLDDAANRPTLMRAYRWLARDARQREDLAAERGFLDRAVELGEQRAAEQPSEQAARALAAALGLLADVERREGAVERSEQQLRQALQVLERQLVEEEQAKRDGVALRVQMSRALLALGDLERARTRRASARGYYERASASAKAASEAGGEALRAETARRLLIAAGLRRLAPDLVDAEAEPVQALCGELLAQHAEWLAGVPRPKAGGAGGGDARVVMRGKAPPSSSTMRGLGAKPDRWERGVAMVQQAMPPTKRVAAGVRSAGDPELGGAGDFVSAPIREAAAVREPSPALDPDALPVDGWRSLAILLDRCPRFPTESASGPWLVERLDAGGASPALLARLRTALAAPPLSTLPAPPPPYRIGR